MDRKFGNRKRRNDVTRNRRRRWATLVSLVVLVGAAMIVVQAIPGTVFLELDNNVADIPAGSPDDWANVYCRHDVQVYGVADPDCLTIGDDHAGSSVFVHDATGATIFTGGGSKDDLDVPSWLHSAGSVPDKDELLDGFVARYGDHMYFGADRLANNGDAQMGFWFMQGDVAAQSNGTFGPDPHFDGDLLILSDFTKGGGHPTVQVFRWNPPGCVNPDQSLCPPEAPAGTLVDGVLERLFGTPDISQDCDTVLVTDPVCATVNDTDLSTTSNPKQVPWPFTPKSGSGIRSGELYEGGIDLSNPAFAGLTGECFASFLVETRSSQSTDAVLKDFLGGQFERCQSDVATAPVSAQGDRNGTTAGLQVFPGDDIHDSVTSFSVSGVATWTGTLDFFLCAPAQLTPATTGTCSTAGSGSPVGSVPIDNTTPLTSMVSNTFDAATTPGKYCFRVDFTSPTPNVEDASFDGEDECFFVIQLKTTIGTTQTWNVFDTATLSSENGSNLTGTLTFTLYRDVTNTSDCTTGTQVGAPTVRTVTDAASGSTFVSESYGPFTADTVLSWLVQFDGTAPNLSVTHSCHKENTGLDINNGLSTTSP
jgi:hypothetical protein